MGNLEELNYLYRKIVVAEMVEKLKSGGVVWDRLTPYQYRSTVFQGGDCWDMYLTSLGGSVVLDFRKNARHFYSVNSSDDLTVASLYQELADDGLCDEQSLLADIQQFEGCGLKTYNQKMSGGILTSGDHVTLLLLWPPSESGILVYGEADVRQPVQSFISSTDGPLLGGYFESTDNVFSVEAEAAGVLADGRSNTIYRPTVTGYGVRVNSGAVDSKVTAPASAGGSSAGGTAGVTTKVTQVVEAAGVWVGQSVFTGVWLGGAAANHKVANASASGGVAAAGSAAERKFSLPEVEAAGVLVGYDEE